MQARIPEETTELYSTRILQKKRRSKLIKEAKQRIKLLITARQARSAPGIIFRQLERSQRPRARNPTQEQENQAQNNHKLFVLAKSLSHHSEKCTCILLHHTNKGCFFFNQIRFFIFLSQQNCESKKCPYHCLLNIQLFPHWGHQLRNNQFH